MVRAGRWEKEVFQEKTKGSVACEKASTKLGQTHAQVEFTDRLLSNGYAMELIPRHTHTVVSALTIKGEPRSRRNETTVINHFCNHHNPMQSKSDKHIAQSTVCAVIPPNQREHPEIRTARGLATQQRDQESTLIGSRRELHR